MIDKDKAYILYEHIFCQLFVVELLLSKNDKDNAILFINSLKDDVSKLFDLLTENNRL